MTESSYEKKFTIIYTRFFKIISGAVQIISDTQKRVKGKQMSDMNVIAVLNYDKAFGNKKKLVLES